MPRTLIGVIYDVKTLAVRRIVAPDDDVDLIGGVFSVMPGEAMTLSPRANGTDVHAAIDAVRLATGREPPTLEQIHAQGL